MVLKAGSVRPWILLLGVSLYLLCVFAQSPLTFCDPMDCSTPAFPVLHHLLEFTQTHVHWVCDAIHPSHPPSSPFPPAFNLPQHWGLFQWVVSLHQVAKYWSFSINHFSKYSGLISSLTGLISLLPKGLSTPPLLQHHHSKASILQCSAIFYGPTLTSVHNYWKNYNFD